VHCLRPESTCAKQLLVCALQEVLDRAFGYAVLEVSIHTTEGELLVLFVAGLFECVIGKLLIVAMVMLNFYAVLRGKGLKGSFGGDGLDG
jgi:hypothetical protein